MRHHPRLLAGRERDGAQVVPLAEHDQVEPVEVAHTHPVPRRERVVGRGGQDERVVEEGRGHDQRIGHGQDHEGQVDLARRNPGHQLVGTGLHHRQVDAGMAGVEGDQGRGQRARDETRGRAHGEAAACHTRERPGLGARGLHVGQNPLHEGQQGGAVGGQRDRALAGTAVEEHHAEFVFEQADLARQRGLRQVEASRGLGEALLLGHGEGVGELVELHPSELTALKFMLFMSLTCYQVDRRVAAGPGSLRLSWARRIE